METFFRIQVPFINASLNDVSGSMCRGLEVCQMGTGSWQLATGSRQLEAGSWQLTADS
jgi:hypothetical protein